MQRLTVERLRPEMVAAVDVVDPLGKILIRAGIAFQESHINALVENGFKSVYVSLSPFRQRSRSRFWRLICIKKA